MEYHRKFNTILIKKYDEEDSCANNIPMTAIHPMTLGGLMTIRSLRRLYVISLSFSLMISDTIPLSMIGMEMNPNG